MKWSAATHLRHRRRGDVERRWRWRMDKYVSANHKNEAKRIAKSLHMWKICRGANDWSINFKFVASTLTSFIWDCRWLAPPTKKKKCIYEWKFRYKRTALHDRSNIFGSDGERIPQLIIIIDHLSSIDINGHNRQSRIHSVFSFDIKCIAMSLATIWPVRVDDSTISPRLRFSE